MSGHVYGNVRMCVKAFMRQGSRESTMIETDSAESVCEEYILINLV